MILTPNSAEFVPEAEKLSYCSAMDPNKFSDARFENFKDYHTMYETVGNQVGADPYFILCDNDRLNEGQRKSFCQGSETSLSGRHSMAGIRMRARVDITDVCDIEKRRCVLYAQDPQGWTVSRVVDALKDYDDGTYIINLVPVSHLFLELLSFWTTKIDTTWFNNPLPPIREDVGPIREAYTEAAITSPIFKRFGKVRWKESANVVPQICRAGGPDSAKAFGILWATVEKFRGPSDQFEIMTLGAGGKNQTTTFTEDEVYVGFPDINARLDNREVVLKSAFDAEAAGWALRAAPADLAPRFAYPKRAVFDGTPSDTVSPTCTRIYTERKIEMYNILFKQDVDGCRALAEVDRVPVIVSGANARDSVLDNVHVVGGSATLVVRGQDSSVFSDIVAANVDVNNLLLRGVSGALRWRDGCSGTALECSNITYMPGISLALARADGNVVFDECPFGDTELWACSAGRGRAPAAVLVTTEAGQPMFDWKTQSMPPACSTECLANETGTYCYQGYAYSCSDGKWTGESAIEPTEVDEQSSFGNSLTKKTAGHSCVSDGVISGRTSESSYPWGDVPPCAINTEALMSTGALIRASNLSSLAEKVLTYAKEMSSHQRCSTLGCPGLDTVVLKDGFYRCGIADTYVEDTGWWEWHFHPEVPLKLSGVHAGDQNHAALPWRPVGRSGDPFDVSVEAPEIQQSQIQLTDGVCIARDGMGVVAETCRDFSEAQNWLFVRMGETFRLEIPNDPFTCVFKSAPNASVVLLPCPPCLYGSSAPEVSMNAFADMPMLSRPDPVPPAPIALVPISTDPVAGPVLTVNTETGLCLCEGETVAPLYACTCSLANYKRADVDAQLGSDGCRDAAGALLAACERLGAGLAAVDGQKETMALICAALGSSAATVVGADGTDGHGASVACTDGMVSVVTMGSGYQPSEALTVVIGDRSFPGLTAITSKVVYQPHSSGMPTTITAPYRTVINASGFLAVFGTDNLYRITTEGFSTGGVVWAGVIVEIVIITLVLILHCAFAATSASKVAQARERVSQEKKVL
jgi:hypothetical protein